MHMQMLVKKRLRPAGFELGNGKRGLKGANKKHSAVKTKCD